MSSRPLPGHSFYGFFPHGLLFLVVCLQADGEFISQASDCSSREKLPLTSNMSLPRSLFIYNFFFLLIMESSCIVPVHKDHKNKQCIGVSYYAEIDRSHVHVHLVKMLLVRVTWGWWRLLLLQERLQFMNPAWCPSVRCVKHVESHCTCTPTILSHFCLWRLGVDYTVFMYVCFLLIFVTVLLKNLSDQVICC